ncbi:MAG: HpcH/HpaI aldolase/citrate lyase family protein [Bacteroidota bacterium]
MKSNFNPLKASLKKGEKRYGIWHGIPHTYAAEICAGSGFDWVCIDGEHGPFTPDQMLHHLQAIEPHEATTMVRVPSGDASLIKRVLDFGAQNIVVPMVESAEQAERIVRSMKYPPEGFRGVGGGIARGAQWNRIENYLHKANDQICSILQIESVKGVEALDDILKIEGVDVLFMGPADLAASMGYLGNASHPKVVETTINCIQKIVAAGKIAGFLSTYPDSIQSYTEAGATMIGVAVDTDILKEGTEELASRYKAHS